MVCADVAFDRDAPTGWNEPNFGGMCKDFPGGYTRCSAPWCTTMEKVAFFLHELQHNAGVYFPAFPSAEQAETQASDQNCCILAALWGNVRYPGGSCGR